VIGSANVDYTVGLPRLPNPEETVSGGTLLVNLGAGANQAVAAQRLGGEVRLIGCVGDDADGRRIKESLAAAGIGVAGLCATADAATGTAIIMVDAQGRNQIAVAPGANHRLTVDMVEPYAESIAWAEVVACQLETPLPVVSWALGDARRHGVITVLNPAPVQPLDEDLLALVDYLTPNEHEAGSLTDRAVKTHSSPRGRRRRGAPADGAGVVLVTMGEQGVCSPATGERHSLSPPFPWTRWIRRPPVTPSAAPWPWGWPRAARLGRRFPCQCRGRPRVHESAGRRIRRPSARTSRPSCAPSADARGDSERRAFSSAPPPLLVGGVIALFPVPRASSRRRGTTSPSLLRSSWGWRPSRFPGAIGLTGVVIAPCPVSCSRTRPRM
jgi:ribokinase